MQVFRLARYARRYDLSGYGAYLYGGRWNLPGMAVLYTAELRALALVEALVHFPVQDLPDDMYLLTLEVPDELSREELTADKLPADWQRLTQPQRRIGRTAASGASGYFAVWRQRGIGHGIRGHLPAR